MKAFKFLLLLACLASVTLWTGEWLISGGENPVLASLESLNPGTKISSNDMETFTGTGICSKIWKDNGACWKQDALQTAFEKLIKNIGERTVLFIRGLSKARKAMSKIFKLLGRGNALWAHLKKGRDKDQDGKKALPWDPESSDGKAMLKLLLGYSEDFDNLLDFFKNNGKSWFLETVKYRGQAVCTAWSGVGRDNYVTSGGIKVFKILPQACSSVVTKCNAIWGFGLHLGLIKNLLFVMRKGNGKAKNSDKVPIEAEARMANGKTTKDVMDAFKGCKDSSSSSCTDAHKATICDAFLNLKGNPVVEGQESMVENIGDESDEAEEDGRILATEADGNTKVDSGAFDATSETNLPEGKFEIDYSDTGAFIKKSISLIVILGLSSVFL